MHRSVGPRSPWLCRAWQTLVASLVSKEATKTGHDTRQTLRNAHIAQAPALPLVPPDDEIAITKVRPAGTAQAHVGSPALFPPPPPRPLYSDPDSPKGNGLGPQGVRQTRNH